MDLKKYWADKVLPLLKAGVESTLKPALEVYVENLIAKRSDEIVEKIAIAVKAAIPGEIDNMMIDAKLVAIKAQVKKDLLEEAEKISDKV